jgi:hypothetical protein
MRAGGPSDVHDRANSLRIGETAAKRDFLGKFPLPIRSQGHAFFTLMRKSAQKRG